MNTFILLPAILALCLPCSLSQRIQWDGRGQGGRGQGGRGQGGRDGGFLDFFEPQIESEELFNQYQPDIGSQGFNNPCARTLCPVNTRCVVQQVYCIRAPCPLQAICQPSNQNINKPGFCPRRQLNQGATICQAFCNDDNDCPRRQKCCSRGCTLQCIRPVFDQQTRIIKQGICPRPSQVNRCGATVCRDDGDCRGSRKCCRSRNCPGRRCINTSFRRRQCPFHLPGCNNQY